MEEKIINRLYSLLEKGNLDRETRVALRLILDLESRFGGEKYGVYEVCTWDDVNYTKIASFENEWEANNLRDLLNTYRRRCNYNPDPICYCVMSDIKYLLMMSN